MKIKNTVQDIMKYLLIMMIASGMILNSQSGMLEVKAAERYVTEKRAENKKLSETFIKKFNNYIALDLNSNKFYVVDSVKEIADTEELKQLRCIIEETNNTISQYHLEETLVDSRKAMHSFYSTSRMRLAARAKYRNGVTKIDTFWWGVKVFISRSDVNNIGKVYTFGGTLAALGSAQVAIIIGAMGYAMGNVPGGFSFNLTWPQIPTLPLLAMNPITVGTIIATWSWQ